MEITNKQLEKRFSEMSDDELVELLKDGGLTATAKSILNSEINSRDMSSDEPACEQPIEEAPRKKREIKSRLTSGFLGSLAGMGFGSSVFTSAGFHGVKSEIAETALHLASGVMFAIIFFVIFIFISEKTARRWAVCGIALSIVFFIPDLMRVLTR